MHWMYGVDMIATRCMLSGRPTALLPYSPQWTPYCRLLRKQTAAETALPRALPLAVPGEAAVQPQARRLQAGGARLPGLAWAS
jgi:hypothetical protein